MNTTITNGFLLRSKATGMFLQVHKSRCHVGYRFTITETFMLSCATVHYGYIERDERDALRDEGYADDTIEQFPVRVTTVVEVAK